MGAAFFGLLLLVSGAASSVYVLKAIAAPSTAQEAASIDALLTDVIAGRLETVGDDLVDFGDQSEVNILLLGLDARTGWDAPHCDAIHMLTLNIDDWTMQITSVPRGTTAYIPGEYEEHEYYLANACAFAGLDHGIREIEKVLGVKHDYLVTVGFSQTIGILRAFELPTTEGLQWLRHRQSYAIGDPQRSHNQAVFMKDVIVGHLNKFRSVFALPMQLVLYNSVNTDLPFAHAKALLHGFVSAEIDARPDDIVLAMKPYYETVDYHFDPEHAAEQIEEKLDRVAPYLSREDLSRRSLEEIQKDLMNFLDGELERESYEDVMAARTWLQVEDSAARASYHYKFVELAYNALRENDFESAKNVITDYLLEAEALGEWSYAVNAEYMLAKDLAPDALGVDISAVY